MKRCPSCQRTYDDAQSFCSVDGTPLGRDTPDYEPAPTIVASPQPPPSSQPYPPQQWTPPQQQWPPQPTAQGISPKVFIGTIAGLVLLVGVGLLIYFLTRSSSPSSTSTTPNTSSRTSTSTTPNASSSTSSPTSSSTSSSSNPFVGTWISEEDGRKMKIKDDGTLDRPDSGGNPGREGMYERTGDVLTYQSVEEDTVKLYLESKDRLRAVQIDPQNREKTEYFKRE